MDQDEPSKPAGARVTAKTESTAESTDLSNHFLLAMPNMADPNFSGAVVLIAEHSERGALGLVVNKPTTMTLATLLERIDLAHHDDEQARMPVFFGGPVQTDRGFVLHQPQGDWNSTVAIGPDLSLTTSKDVLEAVAEGEGPERLLVTLGYAGWGPGQLEEEIAQNGWLHCAATESLIFDRSLDNKYDRALALMGINPAMLSMDAGHA